MPVFGNDSYAEGIVQVGATGATGAVAYQANNGDIVLATGGASGSGGVVVTLPNIVTLFPAVAVQPPVGPLTAHDIIAVNGATGASGASGSLYGEVISGYLGDTNPPVSPDADSLCVQVKLVAQVLELRLYLLTVLSWAVLLVQQVSRQPPFRPVGSLSA